MVRVGYSSSPFPATHGSGANPQYLSELGLRPAPQSSLSSQEIMVHVMRPPFLLRSIKAVSDFICLVMDLSFQGWLVDPLLLLKPVSGACIIDNCLLQAVAL